MVRHPETDAQAPWSGSADAETAAPAAKGAAKEWDSLRPAVGDTGSVQEARTGSSAGAASSGSAASAETKAASEARASSGTRASSGSTAPSESVGPSGSAGPRSSRGASRGQSREAARGTAARRATARDSALTDRPRALRLRQTVLAAAVPFVVLMLSVRLVATPVFMWAVYHWPGFPEDRFGFSLQDRMLYGSYGLDYVLNFAPERYLGELTTAQGEAVFTPAEVSHMTDVKHVILWSLLLVGLLTLLAWACSWGLRRRAPGAVSRALFIGAWSTVVLTAVLGVLGALGWETFFISFHKILFSGGNWSFRASDSLIRLYPDPYWVLSALGILVTGLLLVTLLMVLTWPTAARRARREQDQADRDRTASRLRG